MEELLAGHTLSWQGECCVSCVCVSLLWCEEHFSNHDPVLLSNWIKCDFRLCRERKRERGTEMCATGSTSSYLYVL